MALEGLSETLYRFGLAAGVSETDVYSIVLSIKHEGEGDTVEAERMLKLTTVAKVKDAQVAVSDLKDMTDARSTALKFGEQSDDVVVVGKDQHLHVSFRVQDTTGKAYEPHQLFLRFTHKPTGRSSVLIPKLSDDNSIHVASPTPEELSKALQYMSGDYVLHLLMGDIFLENNMAWRMCELVIATQPLPFRQEVPDRPILHALPEIQYVFKDPPAR